MFVLNSNKEKDSKSKMNELTPLNRRKGGIKAQLTKLGKFISEEIEQCDIVDLTNKIELLYKIENKLEDLKLD